MEWLNPYLLFGALAAAIPVAIHLIGRQRAPSIKFAAFEFLVAINARLARREKLRQFLLLATRTLLFLMLALAVARPFLERPEAATGTTTRVAVIIDGSASMRYLWNGQSLWRRAVDMAKDELSRLQPGDAATLIVADSVPETLTEQPTLDVSALRRALDDLAVGTEGADIAGALELALDELGDGPAHRRVVVISDFSANSFTGLRPLGEDETVSLIMLDPAERESPGALPNVGLEDVTIRPTGASVTQREISVKARNYGTQAVEKRRIRLNVAGVPSQYGYISMAPNGVSEKVFTLDFAKTGEVEGFVALEPSARDGFESDDIIHFTTILQKSIRVLVVNGDPRTIPQEDEVFFMERALTTVPSGEAPIALRIVNDTSFDAGDIDPNKVDIVCLANVARLVPETVSALSTFVSSGGGLFITMGDRVHFEAFNESMGELLPRDLRDLFLAENADADASAIGIAEQQQAHPIIAGLDQDFESSLRQSQTRAYFNLDPSVGDSRWILKYENGAPALLEKMLGSGRVMLLTTSIDLTLSNLALTAAFPPLIQRSMRHLANSLATPNPSTRRAGQPIAIDALKEVVALQVTAPDKNTAIQNGRGENGRFNFRFDASGIYRVSTQDAGNDWARAPYLDFALAPDLSESDFRPVHLSKLTRAVTGETSGDSVWARRAGAEEAAAGARGYASILLLVMILALTTESLLASRG